jgi:hypothetical protein
MNDIDEPHKPCSQTLQPNSNPKNPNLQEIAVGVSDSVEDSGQVEAVYQPPAEKDGGNDGDDDDDDEGEREGDGSEEEEEEEEGGGEGDD